MRHERAMKKIITSAAIAGAVITGAAGLTACDPNGYAGPPYVTARYECGIGQYCVEYSDGSYEYVPYDIWQQMFVGALISRSMSGGYSLSRAPGYAGSYTKITNITVLHNTSVKPYTLSKGSSSSSYSKPASSFKSRSAYKSYSSAKSSYKSTSGSSYKSGSGSSYKSGSGSSYKSGSSSGSSSSGSSFKSSSSSRSR